MKIGRKSRFFARFGWSPNRQRTCPPAIGATTALLGAASARLKLVKSDLLSNASTTREPVEDSQDMSVASLLDSSCPTPVAANVEQSKAPPAGPTQASMPKSPPTIESEDSQDISVASLLDSSCPTPVAAKVEQSKAPLAGSAQESVPKPPATIEVASLVDSSCPSPVVKPVSETTAGLQSLMERITKVEARAGAVGNQTKSLDERLDLLEASLGLVKGQPAENVVDSDVPPVAGPAKPGIRTLAVEVPTQERLDKLRNKTAMQFGPDCSFSKEAAARLDGEHRRRLNIIKIRQNEKLASVPTPARLSS